MFQQARLDLALDFTSLHFYKRFKFYIGNLHHLRGKNRNILLKTVAIFTKVNCVITQNEASKMLMKSNL